MAYRIEKGSSVRDKITGFKGIVTGRADYISGCDTYLVQPPTDKDEKWVESKWFDDLRLEVITAVEPITIDERKRKTGADGIAPIK